MRLEPGTEVKVRDRYAPKKSRRLGYVVEDRGEEITVDVFHQEARGGGWKQRRETVTRDRIIGAK